MPVPIKIVVVVRRTGDDERTVKAEEASDANETVRMRPMIESVIVWWFQGLVLEVELGLAARYLWGFCENETSRETNLARRDFSRD